MRINLLPGLKADVWIEAMATHHEMIYPFIDRQIKRRNGEKSEKIASYGLSSYGYDVRLSEEFKIFTNVNNTVVDPKNFDENSFIEFEGDVCTIPPNSFVLARTFEWIKMPRDTVGFLMDKSTYRRCGQLVSGTVLEPGWEGHITLEISNTTPLPARIYANEGIAQVIFFKSADTCRHSYADRPDGPGKYMGSEGIVLPKL